MPMVGAGSFLWIVIVYLHVDFVALHCRVHAKNQGGRQD